MFIEWIEQSVAVHLVRNYRESGAAPEVRQPVLQAFKLRRIIELMEADLERDELSLTTLYSCFDEQFYGSVVSLRDSTSSHVALSKPFRLGELAEGIGLSSFHFSRLFKKATGLAPSQYMIRLRIAEARRLLRETEQRIIEIGMEFGYSSPSHFPRVFQRQVGLSPTAYRG